MCTQQLLFAKFPFLHFFSYIEYLMVMVTKMPIV